MSELPIQAAFHPATIRQGLTFEELTQVAHKAGFHHTAFGITGAMEYDVVNGPGAALRLFNELDLVPSGWGGSPNIILPPNEFEAGLPGFRGLCTYAANFEIESVLGLMVFMPNRWPIPEQDAFDRVVTNFKSLTEVAAEYEISISIEFCGPNLMPNEPFPFISGVSGAMKIVNAVGKDNLGVLVDSYHLYCAGEVPSDIDRLATGKVFAAHINDSPPGDYTKFTDVERIMPGDGIIPLVDFIKHLAQADFIGPIACELFNPEIRLRDPIEVARESRLKTEVIITEALS